MLNQCFALPLERKFISLRGRLVLWEVVEPVESGRVDTCVLVVWV